MDTTNPGDDAGSTAAPNPFRFGDYLWPPQQTDVMRERLPLMAQQSDAATSVPAGAVSAGQAMLPSFPATTLSYDNTPVPFIDWRGDPVLDPKNGQMMIPKGVDPHFFVDQGHADAAAGPLAVMRGLYNFRQGGPWDLQRPGNMSAFVDAASTAIGLYSAAAGVYPHDLLSLQALYAFFNSKFGDDDPRSFKYWPLPERNVANTYKGYELYRSSRVGPTPGAP
jgi:hypothetical protein